MKRIWHPYASWEDWKAGAWGSVDDKEALFKDRQFSEAFAQV